MKVELKIVGLFLLFCAGLEAFALTYIPIPFEDQVAEADKISIGRVIEKWPVAAFVEGQLMVCGWELVVEVDVDIRGGSETFNVYTNDFSTLNLNDQKYFMMLTDNERYQKSGKEGKIYCEASYNLENPSRGTVDISSIKYLHEKSSFSSPEGYILPLDLYLEKKLGGDWLITAFGIPGGDYTHFVDNDENPDHPDAYIGVNLFEFLKENWALFKAPKVDQE